MNRDTKAVVARRAARKSSNGSRKKKPVEAPAITPMVRPQMRSGRSSFLRALRSRIELAPDKAEILRILDAAVAKYRGE